ncbi:hypothetical protein [Rhizobium gallicum]|uniref:hypothetical protein n=1 Tax=Rhizobium gallicum TaxID=56730 RepID=UPI001EF83489|nr:hypothetical protein [Rhizobium gallicum]ULJ75091.1 hypothetical protein L2W42_32990 [Rhizobium gallicum]
MLSDLVALKESIQLFPAGAAITSITDRAVAAGQTPSEFSPTIDPPLSPEKPPEDEQCFTLVERNAFISLAARIIVDFQNRHVHCSKKSALELRYEQMPSTRRYHTY